MVLIQPRLVLLLLLLLPCSVSVAGLAAAQPATPEPAAPITISPPPAERGLPPPADDEAAAAQSEAAVLPFAQADAQIGGATAPFFGSNLYLTGLERNDRDDREALAALAAAGGARWSREEFVWAEIGRYEGRYLTFYDRHLRTLARNGFGITGMLVTTPKWARQPRCREATYYCPPADVGQFAAFARWVVERYDGDGHDDARDSPRVAAWEIWNEPNFAETWPGSPAEYAALLIAGYTAIKQADPTALVLMGGVYVFDGGRDGLSFLDQVFAANNNSWNAFDILSIHPYLPTVAPDDGSTLRLVTLEGRVRTAQSRLAAWAARYGGATRPLWVTEVGWCTASAFCKGSEALSQQRQASYLARSTALLKALGVAHMDWFQFEDKFDGGSQAKWGDMAIVADRAAGYAPKLAYAAYRTAAAQLGAASFAGYGPLHTHRYDTTKLYARDGGGRYHLVFREADGDRVDVLWQTTGTSSVALPLEAPPGRVALFDRDGGSSQPLLRDGAAQLTVSDQPLYLRQDALPRLDTPSAVVFLLETGAQTPQQVQFALRNTGGGSFAWRVEGLPPWLQAEPAAGEAPGSTTLRLNPALLPASGAEATLLVRAVPEGGERQVQVRVVVAGRVYRYGLPLVSSWKR